MEWGEVFSFMNEHSLAVLATVDASSQPQAALVGFAVTPQLEIVFDTVKSSRKYANLKKNPRAACVIGCITEVTVQYQGIAEELAGEDLVRYQKTYFAKFADGPARMNWEGITYFVVRPAWIRYCDYNPGTQRIEERTA